MNENKMFDLKIDLSSDEIAVLALLLLDLDEFAVFVDDMFIVEELSFSSEFYENLLSVKNKLFLALQLKNNKNERNFKNV